MGKNGPTDEPLMSEVLYSASNIANLQHKVYKRAA